MQNRTNTNRSQNKGFSIFVGDTYVGFLTINEKNVPAETVANLQKPENMSAILAKAELRVWEEKPPTDMTSVDDIMAGVGQHLETDGAVANG